MAEMITTRSPRVREILEHQRAVREAAINRNWQKLRAQKRGMGRADPVNRATGPAHPLWEVLPDGSWSGQPCFIIGGGPSLRGFNFERLRGTARVIAINKAFYDAPFADICFAMDYPFLEWVTQGKLGEDYQKAFRKFIGAKVWLDISGYGYPEDIFVVPSAGEHGWTHSLKEGLCHGQNSGYGALNLAIVLGANPIYLLGYDMNRTPDGHMNYHGGYPTASGPHVLETYRKNFEAGAVLLNGKPRVVNLNPKSALRCFEIGNMNAIPDFKKSAAVERGYIVVSYYTAGTSYAKEIHGLRQSLDRFKIPYHIFTFEPTGTWRGNLNYKSGCILQAFDMFPTKDIVFLDCDAIVRQRPRLFDELSAHHKHDLSACFFKYDPKSGDADELLSGTLWIQNNKVGCAVVKRWHDIGLARPDVRHQMCLKAAVEDLAKEGVIVRVNRHPFAYTCIFDYYAARGVVPVIEHFQASRRFRREVGYGQNLLVRRT